MHMHVFGVLKYWQGQQSGNSFIWLKCVAICLCRYGHMIDNVVLIVTGTLHERDVQELLEKCHPLGMFDRYWLHSQCVNWLPHKQC